MTLDLSLPNRTSVSVGPTTLITSSIVTLNQPVYIYNKPTRVNCSHNHQ